jgi:ectoine hydroxylase-related dioxygenase (phytanoyl-CoA dioxygenase family)
MDIGQWDTTSDLNDIYQDVVKYGLVENIAELEAFGFTVVPPERVAPPEFHERLREAIIDAHERRTGHRITDLSSDRTGERKAISTLWALLVEDRVFEEALLNPAVYTFARYMCGKSVVLSDMIALLKNQDDRPSHTLHLDQIGVPPPLASYPQVGNVTWTLTDYTLENGPVAIVPGSHRFGRPPMPYEENFLADDAPVKAIPVEARAGSLIVWGGTTWHASYPRKAPGLRMNVVFVFARSYMRPVQDFRNVCPPEVVDRNPPEFAQLLGINHPFPYEGATPPPYERIVPVRRSGRNPWA